MVIAVAAHIVGDTATAEDIASEAFERLARQTVDVRDKDAWLRTAAYRSALNELRRREATASTCTSTSGSTRTTGPAILTSPATW
jgi:DNA-directed RNA polymerase specialized sigma24 family protein